MSYLNFPRLIFSGKFQTDPSTVNNDPEHFNSAKFQPNYELPGQGASNGWWNPNGSAAWRFKDCTVQRVDYKDGSSCDLAALDPVVGMEINSVVDRVEGKLVDLDPEQQMVSAIWGFQVFLGSKTSEIGFGGDYEVASFGDIWVRFAQGQPDSFFSAYYQSVIDLTKSVLGAQNSRFLKELKECMGKGNQLSIKFTVDGYNDDMSSPDFTFGRITGAIGVQQPDEPHQFVSGRAILANPQASPALNTAYALVDGDFLHLDLGNSLPTTAAGGPLQNFGNLNIATENAQGETVLLGEVDYTSEDWYMKTAGILTVRISGTQRRMLNSHPISLVQVGSTGQYSPFAAEASNGEFVRADQFVFRFNPPDTDKAVFYATRFGRPKSNATISFQLDSTVMEGQQTQGAIPGPPAGTVNPKTGKYPLSFPGATQIGKTAGYQIKTGRGGRAELKIKATAPGNPRGYIDGQVFGITYQLGNRPPAIGSQQNPSQLLNLLVFDAYKIPDQPTWIEDVQPIFQQYADLYPVMRRIVDLSNFGSVMKHRSILRNVFSTPESNPNYMPVTRDLSKPKREMLLKWLENPVYMNLDSVPQLHKALQTAIELEHATIPTYLAAYFSIKSGENTEVANLIRSVVIEEMLHMSLACNILISLGGKPDIGKPGFVPNYPGSLPGGLRNDLTVTLKKASVAQIRDVFMSIEEPDEMIVQRMRRMDPNIGAKSRKDPNMKEYGEMEYYQYTIGWFYNQIKEALTNLAAANEITFGNADKQVKEWSGQGKLFVVENLQDALDAIDEILEQGEGNNATDPYDGDNELAHYYKFAEIVNGRQLVPTPDGGYAYTGPVIPFDEAGVWPVVNNASIVSYPAGSRAAHLSDQFNEAYKALLFSLHETFNGKPENIRNSIGGMYALTVIAAQLVQTDSGLGDGTTAGPQFRIDWYS